MPKLKRGVARGILIETMMADMSTVVTLVVAMLVSVPRVLDAPVPWWIVWTD